MEYTVFGADEVWLAAVGHEGHYEVSSYGRVRSVAKQTTRGWRPQVMRKLAEDTHGYPIITLKTNKKQRRVRVHTLVAEAFLPKPEDADRVCHRNDIPNQNWVWNLYWGTAKDNSADCVRHGNNHRPVRKTHCPSGHEYSEENTVLDYEGYQQCRKCRTANSYRAYLVRRAKQEAADAKLEESCTAMKD